MFSFNDMSIKRKLTLVILLTCTAVLLIAGAATISTEYFTSRRQLAQDMTVLADLLGRNTTAAVSFHREEDLEEVNQTLSAVQADPHIIAVCIYDKDGERFGQYVRPGSTMEFPQQAPATGQRFSMEYLEVSNPIMLNDKSIGSVYLRTDLEGIYYQIALRAGIVGAVLFGAMLATIALAPRLRKPIAEPILELAKLAQRVAQEKDYSARAVKRNKDEIGLLTDAFNHMLGEIERGQLSLQKANAELAVAKDAAEAANRAKDQFLAVLSHELRTPLTPVLLTVSLLQNREALSQETQDDIQTIRRHVELEARLIDDLLDLTRITRGKLKLHFETADAHLLIRDALEICCADRLRDFQLALDAKHYHVRVDPARFLQICWNILSNARKFSPSGKPITVRTSNPTHDLLRIQVIDQGVGIEPTIMPRIFNAFEQGDSSLTRAFGGLGLGLTIAKALVDAHGGTIHAESEGRGRGASFTVEMATAIPAPPRPSKRRPPLASAPDPTSLRILLVEDHPGTLALMTRLLQGLGHDVKSAATVKDAIAIADQGQIDLVISDLGLPDGTGHDVMRALRTRYSVKGIALSGFGMDEDIRKSMEAGFVKHLTKPVDAEQLQVAIRQIVD